MSSSTLPHPAAMLRLGQTQSVDRDVLFDITAELLEARDLLGRLGADLRAVAKRSNDQR